MREWNSISVFFLFLHTIMCTLCRYINLHLLNNFICVCMPDYMYMSFAITMEKVCMNFILVRGRS